MKKIKFTSKRLPKPSKLQRAAGETRGTMIYYQGESIMSVSENRLCLYCEPVNVHLVLKKVTDHKEAVNWVKAHAQELWETYPFRLKLKKENAL